MSSAIPGWSRRTFVKVAAAIGGSGWLWACRSGTSGPEEPDPGERFPLRFAPSVSPDGLTLTGAPASADLGGVVASVWALNGVVSSPTLRARRGSRVRITMQNQLPQDLILHWHGLTPPEAMDGHPRLAVGPGGSYAYDFSIGDRAGTYWYHSHAHMRTGEQTYRGIAGLVLVTDGEEEALGLPAGARELPLIVQDRRVDTAGRPIFDLDGPTMLAGLMGSEPFVNGVRRPYHEVDTALYRLRILNGSNARIMRLAMSDGRPVTLIGNDGGLLPAPVSLPHVDLGPAERADCLLDLRSLAVGDRVMLRSIAFQIPGGMDVTGGANLQGQPLDLLQFRVTRRVEDPAMVPETLPPLDGPREAEAVRERTFRFQSLQMQHTINGVSFDMSREDVVVPFGETEIWTLVNESTLPHPVHLHATHFRVLSRLDGRGAVQPWEGGLKDTVLLMPLEVVRVAVRFTAERGLFLLHCHNLEHEDMGMMMNIRVV
ncbi:MAG TPA: multicopper oxidase domain-containing protein [Gemmatimonadales bacterium]|nr:multicopper oxidase domain-containing protein [Gemmatimonadales bacterium]